MKFTVKNLKISEFASHETTCFEATVYIDGKRAFLASNGGYGGANEYSPLHSGGKYDEASRDLLKRVEEWVAEQPEITETISGHEDEPFKFKPDLDHYVNEAVYQVQGEKELKKILRKGAVWVNDAIATYKCKPDHPRWREVALKNDPEAIILNDLPFSEAMVYYKKLTVGASYA